MQIKLPVDSMAYSADYTRDYWHCYVDPGTTLADVKKSVFWSHVLGKLKPGALIDLMTRDGLFDVQVRVVAVNNGLVKVNILRHFEDEKARKPILKALAQRTEVEQAHGHGVDQARELSEFVPDGYKVGYHPVTKTFYAQLLVNGLKIIENQQTRELALRAARLHARAAGVEVPEWPDEEKEPA